MNRPFSLWGRLPVYWGPCQIRKIPGYACTGNAGNVSQPPRVSDPGMHHGTCVTHVPWCRPGKLTGGFLWSRWRGKRSRHSLRMLNPQFYVSGKRPTRPGVNATIRTRLCDYKYWNTSNQSQVSAVIACYHKMSNKSGLNGPGSFLLCCSEEQTPETQRYFK